MVEQSSSYLQINSQISLSSGTLFGGGCTMFNPIEYSLKKYHKRLFNYISKKEYKVNHQSANKKGIISEVDFP
jgi:hypothetical protein